MGVDKRVTLSSVPGLLSQFSALTKHNLDEAIASFWLLLGFKTHPSNELFAMPEACVVDLGEVVVALGTDWIVVFADH